MKKDERVGNIFFVIPKNRSMFAASFKRAIGRLKLESAEVQIGYAAIYRTLKAWVFDWNKRAISRSKKQALAYHLRRKGKDEVRSGINAGKAPIFVMPDT